MEPPLSSRSSASSHNRSQDNIEPLSLLRSNTYNYRASQSLTSVINAPDSSYFQHIYDYLLKSLNFGIEPSAILQDINPADFTPYLSKIGPLLNQKSSVSQEICKDSFTLSACFSTIPQVFFSESFDLKNFLDESSVMQQEVISGYLDLTDVSIFNMISVNWKDLMKTAYNLEEMNSEIEKLLEKVIGIKGNSVALQQKVMEKYLGIIRLNRRLGNIKKVLKKLKLMSEVQSVQPKMNEMINEGLYTSVFQLLAKTQETFRSELRGIISISMFQSVMEKTKTNLLSQLDQEFSLLAHKFIILNTFNHTEKLVKLLKNNASLESTFKIFPKEENYERISELIRIKINTNSLQQSLQELTKSLCVKIKENIKNMNILLGVRKTDENSKWINISHPHFIIILQSILATFQSIFQKFVSLATLVLRQVTTEQGTYTELLRTLASSPYKNITQELTQLESRIYSIFFNKFKKIVTTREQILINSNSIELKELYELTEKVPMICKHLTVQSSNQVILMSLQIQKKFLNIFHENKASEVRTILDGEVWSKVEIPQEMMKFIMDRRGEASKIAGIKLESPEVSATGSLLIFYKIIYEYIRLTEELQISLEVSTKLIDMLKSYNKRTYELIVEAQAVPHKFTKVTAKHLGLSVQGLSLILQEFPYIENRLISRVKDFSAIVYTDFNAARQDFVSHLKAIYEKLSNIIKSRIGDHCKNALSDAKWDTMISPSQIDTNYYIKQITTDLISMHSILLTVLNAGQIYEVFTAILEALAENLVELFSKIKIDSYIPAQRVKNDVQQLLIILREKFSNSLLEPLEELEDRLQKFVADHCENFLRGSL